MNKVKHVQVFTKGDLVELDQELRSFSVDRVGGLHFKTIDAGTVYEHYFPANNVSMVRIYRA